MKKLTLRPHPDRVDNTGAYIFAEAVPVNIFIDGQKIEAPEAGVKIGRPMFPDIDHGTVAVALGDFIKNPKT